LPSSWNQLHVLRLPVNSAGQFLIRSSAIREAIVIRGYTDHAANERTFLAWLRTGIAVIAFGFVVEKFNLFVLTIASSTSTEAAQRLLERLQGPFGRYDGHALIFGGLGLIVVATVRFVRTGRLLDDPQAHSA